VEKKRQKPTRMKILSFIIVCSFECLDCYNLHFAGLSTHGYFALVEYKAIERAYLSALAIEPTLHRSKSFKVCDINFFLILSFN
jgi:hypothetical protein